MRKKIALATVTLMACTGLSSAAVQSSTAAPERASAHTKRFVLKEVASRNLGDFSFAGTDRVKSRATREFRGFASYSATFNPDTERARLWVGIALRGGVIHGRVNLGESDRFTGKITGGNGRYQGITGTITGRATSGNRTFVTLRYIL